MSYILISNDDGIDSPGIRAMADCVAGKGKIIVVAPDGPRSAQSSALTVVKNIHIRPYDDFGDVEAYVVDGTPVDCVKLAVHLFGVPSFVFGGINHGPNDGNSVIYSGTMGVVVEGCMLGVPSVGFSHIDHSWHTDFEPYKPVVSRIAADVIAAGLPKGVCLNVNMPLGGKVEGVRTVRAARGYWVEEFDEIQPLSEYKSSGKFLNLDENDPTTDKYWLDRGFASIVPVSPDMTAFDVLNPLTERFDSLFVE